MPKKQPEFDDYFGYSGPYRRERDANVLRGLIEGISYDGKVSEGASSLLRTWAEKYDRPDLGDAYSYLAGGVLQVAKARSMPDTTKRRLLNLCDQVIREHQHSNDVHKQAMQQFHGILGGIAASGRIDKSEIEGTRGWLSRHKHLQGMWPYDEVDAIITSVAMTDEVDPELEQYLLGLCGEFILGDPFLILQDADESLIRYGICAACPVIQFDGRKFNVTGRSGKMSRQELVETVEQFGGRFVTSISKKLDYLLVCSEGNAAWAYRAYGRKIEQAMTLRKDGARIAIVHENDFWDTVEDMR